jgi:hypothetical protein
MGPLLPPFLLSHLAPLIDPWESRPEDFLRQETREIKKILESLDAAVSSAMSYRERSARLLEEANRALSRLEQVCVGKGEGCGLRAWKWVEVAGVCPLRNRGRWHLVGRR